MRNTKSIENIRAKTGGTYRTKLPKSTIRRMTFHIHGFFSELQRSYDIRRHHSGSGSGGGEDDRYIPYKVYQYIREKSELCIQFQTTIQNRAITLYFITFPESHVSVVCSKSASSSAQCSSRNCNLPTIRIQGLHMAIHCYEYVRQRLLRGESACVFLHDPI